MRIEHTVLAHVAEGHHFTVSLKMSLNILTAMKMITNDNKRPAVIARMRNAFSRIFNQFCHAPTPDPTRTDCRLRGMAESRSVRDEQQIFPSGSGPAAARRQSALGQKRTWAAHKQMSAKCQ